jgi:diguanylate cyclase (GGDEF)-like protein
MAIIAALLIGVGMSLLQIVSDLQQERDRLETQMGQIMAVLSRPAGQALFHVDRVLGAKVLDGLFEYQSIYCARLEDEFGEVYAERRRPLQPHPLRPLFRSLRSGGDEFRLPLRFGPEQRIVGVMVVRLDIFAELLSFLHRSGLVLGVCLLRNLLLALVLLMLYHLTLVRPLQQAIRDITRIDPGRGESRQITMPAHHEDDEIGCLIDSANRLIGRYRAALRERAIAETALQAQQQTLELTVAERTEQLRASNAQLAHQAMHDPLTGLLNRRGLLAQWELCRDERVRPGHALGVLLLDLDRFKQVNDRHGHDAGDALLQAVAKVLDRRIRQSDRCARWGGEELLVLFADLTQDDLRRIAEQLRHAIAEQTLDWGGKPLRVTVSIGACLTRPGDSLDDSVNRADQALYQAKAAGRNRVVIDLDMASDALLSASPAGFA